MSKDMAVSMRTIVSTTLALAAAAALLLAAGCGARQHHDSVQASGEALRLELAELYVTKGARHAAVPLLQRVLADNPHDVRARVLYGSVLRDLGLYPQAERELAFALDTEPRYAPAYAAMGILCDLKREPERALRYHARAVQLYPHNAAWLNNLGFSLYLAGRTSDAIRHFEQALALDPSMVIAYNNLGFAYGRRGDLERAERTFRSALSEAATLLNMALVHEERGDVSTAEALRERAYTLDANLRPDPDQEMEL
jgi:Flp pilus assembly protein TadD